MPGHWHVLGAGAMGCLFAQALHRCGARVTLILREAPAAQVPVVVTRNNNRHESLLDAVTAHNCDSIEHLLVTTKAYDAVQAVASIKDSLNSQSTVLLMVNGMGLVEQLRTKLPRQAIACGTSTEGAYAIDTRHIQHAGRGVTRIGQTGSNHAPEWFKHWQQALSPCHWDDNIQAALWAKLAVNCVINPLTAIHRCRNGDLAQNRYAQDIAQLCQEVIHVSHAAGYSQTAGNIEQTVADVIAGTADNQSSMLQDVLRGRPTEIDYINGYLVDIAQRLDIATPLNSALLAEVKALA